MNYLDRRIDFRRTAPFHLQVQLETDSESLRHILVHGHVVRVFRSDGRIVLGDRIAFRLWVCERGKEPTGEAYVYRDEFGRSTHMELYLHGSPPKWEIVGYEFMLLDSPSESPHMTLRDLEESGARLGEAEKNSPQAPKAPKWWQFWRGN